MINKIIPLLIVVFFIKTLNAQDKMSRYEELRKLSRDSLIKIADDKLKVKYKDYKSENFPHTVVKSGIKNENPEVWVFIDNPIGFAPKGGFGHRGFECELVSGIILQVNLKNETGNFINGLFSICGDSIYNANINFIRDCVKKNNKSDLFPPTESIKTSYVEISEAEEYYLLKSVAESSIVFYKLTKNDCTLKLDHWADLVPKKGYEYLEEIK